MFNYARYKYLADQYAKTNAVPDYYAVTMYLDSVGMKMPEPRYRYDETDMSTWMFLDGRVTFNELTKQYKYKNVFNHNFRFFCYFYSFYFFNFFLCIIVIIKIAKKIFLF